jgi:hypothetical protein
MVDAGERAEPVVVIGAGHNGSPRRLRSRTGRGVVGVEASEQAGGAAVSGKDTLSENRAGKDAGRPNSNRYSAD